ncbi:hypothetical protein OBBRIDRAFT_793778 [Obba rivulosa]|uniref:Uncharacterized protein n=1 Tax=Obba rivulosa TaxID=1052685 RepID=A0A8E2ASU3_9APHY|nr:hypothetical protein OBBRIDRAFT_793778 [Obba rivulosa]
MYIATAVSDRQFWDGLLGPFTGLLLPPMVTLVAALMINRSSGTCSVNDHWT